MFVRRNSNRSWGLFLNKLIYAVQFSETHKVSNVGITTNFVLPSISSFLLYLNQLMLVNVMIGNREVCETYISWTFC